MINDLHCLTKNVQEQN